MADRKPLLSRADLLLTAKAVGKYRRSKEHIAREHGTTARGIDQLRRLEHTYAALAERVR